MDIIPLIQRALYELGFAIPEEELRDGQNGPGTRQAIRQFQERNGLPVTGESDDRTVEAALSQVNQLQFIVRGRVTDRAGNPFVQGFVRAIDQDTPGEQVLGESGIDSEGVYEIVYPAERLHERDKFLPDLVLAVLVMRNDGSAAARSADIQKPRPVEKVDLTVDDTPLPPPPPPSGPFVVRGQIRDEDCTPLVEVLVRAFDKDLRHEQLLGEARTDVAGRYEIHYSAEQFRRADKGSADLLIRVIGPVGTELARSATFFNANGSLSGSDEPVHDVTINLVLGGGVCPEELSEYERLVQDITPVLDGVEIAGLAEDDEHQDVAFLAAETGQDPARIRFLILSHRLAGETCLEPEPFYAFARENLLPVPPDLSASKALPRLLAQGRDNQRRALEAALHDNIIPRRFQARLDAILECLQTLIIDHAFKPLPGTSNLSALLGTVLPSQDQQRTFLTLFVQHQGPVEEAWQTLKADPEFGARVPDLQFALQAAAVARNHLPLVVELQRMREDGQIGSLRDLAALDEAEWRDLINTKVGEQPIGVPSDVPGKDEAEKIDVYALTLARDLAQVFPTAAIAGRIAKDDLVGKDDLVTFFANNPEFEFGGSPVDQYLAERGEAALADVTNPETLTADLHRYERVFKITPRYEEIKPLLAAGLDSALSITGLGPGAFVEKVGDALGQARAEALYAQADHNAALALAVFGNYSAAMNAVPLAVIPDPVPQFAQITGPAKVTNAGQPIAAATLPNLTTLLGPQDFCACEHCQSFYSPSAYLVDILEFLPQTGRDTLFARRPDLQHVELSCANTETPMPHIDLVNEVLEGAIAPLDFDLLPNSETDLDKPTISQPLKDHFANNGFVLSDGATVSIVTPGKQWQIADEGRTFTLSKDTGKIQVWFQTSWTAEELSALPEHTNGAAYKVLAETIYGWDLPFDLGAEQMRTYLEHLGVRRDQLMEAFQPRRPETLTGPAEIAIAAEVVRLTPFEQDIITGVLPRKPWEFWGLQEDNNQVPNPADPENTTLTGTWLDILKHVHVFLRRSGLTYQELLDLLETAFVNPTDPALRIQIEFPPDEHGNATCNLEQAQLNNLTQAAANRIHRFVRLRRKLGWTTRELDKAITALGADDLTEALLVQLAHLQRLRAELDLPLVEILSWFADIDTAPGDEETPSLYDQLFQNKSVLQLETDNPFELNPARKELANTTPTISQHVPGIIAALGIGEPDLMLITGAASNHAQLMLPGELTADTLTLSHLSHLYRIASLARALDLSVREFLSLKVLSGIDPFEAAHMENTRRFVELAGKVSASGFTIIELDYLLRDAALESDALAPSDESTIVLLNEIQVGLRKIVAETAVEPDPTGEITRKKLSLLKWEGAIVEQAIGVLNGSIVDGQKEFVTRQMQVFELPTFSTRLEVLPASIVFPDALRNRISYNLAAKELRFVGFMTAEEKQTLDDLSTEDPSSPYHQAIDILFKAPAPPATFVLEPGNVFLTQADADQLFNPANPLKPEERFALVLGKLTRYLRDSSSKNLVTQKLSAALKLDVAVVGTLLTEAITSPRPPTSPAVRRDALDELVDPAFVDGSDPLDVQIETFRKLHKAALVLEKLKLTPDELRLSVAHVLDEPVPPLKPTPPSTLAARLAAIEPKLVSEKPDTRAWFFVRGPALDWLDLDTLPLAPAPSGQPLLDGWERLVDFVTLRSRVKSGRPSLFAILEIASVARRTTTLTPAQENQMQALYLECLSQRADWDQGDLEALAGENSVAGQLGFVFPDDYQDVRALLRLRTCFGLLKRLGVSAAQVLPWVAPGLAPADELAEGRHLRQAIKAQHADEAEWLAAIQPLQDALREKQRAAMVTYLISQRPEFPDTNALFNHLLIDVEMSACMATSRVKQAISAVQLFVQRALMNLEPPVTIGEQDARHWATWMKNYRVWEANRKVFVYPENYILPELRDDKTPFFKELESELLQGDLTEDRAEEALRHYLEKLDPVARLEIVGMYHQEPDPADTQDRGILHVFGRTHNTPHIYFYRYRDLNTNVWSPWGKVDLDIQGDHLIPVVWNRRLHLFWPIFTEKADEEGQQEGKPPKKHLEIQIAWSEYKNGKWTPKQMSLEQEILTARQFLLPPPLLEQLTADANRDAVLDRSLYVFKSDLTTTQAGDENLVIRCLHKASGRDTSHLDALGLIAIIALPQLANQLPVIDGMAVGEFQFTNCGGAVRVSPFKFGPGSLIVPDRSTIDFQMFKEKDRAPDDPDYLAIPVSAHSDVVTLLATPRTPSDGLPGTFRLLYPHQYPQFISQDAFFYQDETRSFFVQPTDDSVILTLSAAPDLMNLALVDQVKASTVYQRANPLALLPPEQEDADAITDRLMSIAHRPSDSFEITPIASVPVRRSGTHYLFTTFYHPYVCEFIKQLNRYGVDGLLNPNERSSTSRDLIRQQIRQVFFETTYEPDILLGTVDQPLPIEDVDFTEQGAYSIYNWELFFHIPLLIADRLSHNQKFEAAQRWFHTIFDPTERLDGLNLQPGERQEARFWKVRPFFEAARKARPQTIEEMLLEISGDLSVQNLVEEWKDHPFNPHLIARLRARSGAYPRTVVMKYIDNLIRWGDQLFRRETIESINEAALLYILAAEILGARPVQIPRSVEITGHLTYSQLLTQTGLDSLSNALLEGRLPAGKGAVGFSGDGMNVVIGSGKTFVFCIPGNDDLLEYWDRVADRLFKIRHCMNIEGVARQLPLFEPPIDPALLVRAAAAGVDLSTALNDLNAPLPFYRFTTMLQKAVDLCGDVRALGAALLAALEKRDAEELARLRAGHEKELLKEMRQVKERQITEAEHALAGLQAYRVVVETRERYFKDRPKMITEEESHLALVGSSLVLTTAEAALQYAAFGAHLAPDVKIGPDPGPTYGGRNIGDSLQGFAGALGTTASALNISGALAATVGSYQRRQDDWDHQADLATKELAQVDKQILAAEIRVEIAKKDLANHEQQIKNAEQVESVLKDKFTNTELYNWMAGKLSEIYFQSYQLAYDMAKRAERAYRYELADVGTAPFITFGYWDNLTKGLLAGEQLHHDLRRMEAAYLDQNKREYEITKHISLAVLDPVALLALKETGQCFVSLPEAIFDADFPGHYLRRIKTVSLSIPCVTGPYTGVNCTLTLLWNSVRQTVGVADGKYGRNFTKADARFRDNIGAIQSIVTSSGQNDSGVFELTLRDERYLPFEGAGAISDWRIQLPPDTNAFDFNTISDVVIHLRYTARDGGETLKAAARTAMKPLLGEAQPNGVRREPPAALTAPPPPGAGVQLFSARHDFPTEWQHFLSPPAAATEQVLELGLTRDRFPFLPGEKTLKLTRIEWFLLTKNPSIYDDDNPLNVSLTPPDAADASKPLKRNPAAGNVPHREEPLASLEVGEDAPLKVSLKVTEEDIGGTVAGLQETVGTGEGARQRLRADALEDIVLVCHYKVT